MVRWRMCLALALLLLLPTSLSAKNNDDDDDEDSENKEDLKQSKIPIQKPHSRRSEESEEEDDDDDEDDDEGGEEKHGNGLESGMERMERQETVSGRRALVMVTPKSSGGNVPLDRERIPKRRPLECYVCAYKSETPLRACLDPTKFRVHTITCHSVDDRCFTSVISKGEAYEAVVRGCRSGCIGSAETTCCEVNRCNNQAFAMPLIQPRAAAPKREPAMKRSKTNKLLPPTVMFFTTILLILQTVGRVAFI